MSDILHKRLRRIDLAAFSILAVLVLATACFGIFPLYQHTREDENQIHTLRDGLARFDGLSRTVAQVEAELEPVKARLAEAETRLPTSGAMDQFITQLAKVAEEVGLQVQMINPRDIQQGDNYRVMPIEIAGSGSFETCYKFLTGLRQMDRLTRLDNLSIEIDPSLQGPAPSPAALAEPTCKMTISISTFIAR